MTLRRIAIIDVRMGGRATTRARHHLSIDAFERAGKAPVEAMGERSFGTGCLSA